MSEKIEPITDEEIQAWLEKWGSRLPGAIMHRAIARIEADRAKMAKMTEALNAVQQACSESFQDAGTPESHTTIPICPLCGNSYGCDPDCPAKLVDAALRKGCEMKTYRRKDERVEAIRFVGTNLRDIQEFCPWVNYTNKASVPPSLSINGVEVFLGDWIVKHGNGGFFKSTHFMFVKTYEPCEESDKIAHWKDAHATACAGGDLAAAEIRRLRAKLEYIGALCVDYDGFNTSENLKGLIDEIGDEVSKNERDES